MKELSRIQISLEAPTVVVLTDDPLIALFERTAAEAQQAGLTEAEIEAELAAYNAERRAIEQG